MLTSLLLVFLCFSEGRQNEYDISDSFERNFNTDGHERNSTVIPLPARCIPQPKVISLRTGHDLSMQYFPSCTRVDRCGGCCTLEEFFSCQPTEIEMLNMRVVIHKYTGGNQLIPVGKEIVKVEKHLKCKCQCIVKEKDCNSLQRYIKQQCKCLCNNDDEKEKCLQADPKLKFWDSTECTCRCLNDNLDCTTGYVFDKHTCSCKSVQKQIAGQHHNDYLGRL